jgi:hypothetical protein
MNVSEERITSIFKIKSQPCNKPECYQVAGHLPSRLFLARLNFYPEDGGNMFTRNVGSCSDNTALYPRRVTVKYALVQYMYIFTYIAFAFQRILPRM